MHEDEQDASKLAESGFMATFFREQRSPQEAIEHFRRIPWLNQWLSNPAYRTIPTFSRHLKTSGEDYFFSRTVNTPDTIPHFITLQLKDMITPDPTTDDPRAKSPAPSPSSPTHKQPTVVPDLPDCVCLLQLSTPGIDGHPQTQHGGVTCALLDETMGLLIMLHDHNISKPGPRDALFTANLNVSYRAPVATPQAVMVRTWLTKRQGRKWYSKGQIVDEQGKVLAEGDGLWIVARREKL